VVSLRFDVGRDTRKAVPRALIEGLIGQLLLGTKTPEEVYDFFLESDAMRKNEETTVKMFLIGLKAVRRGDASSAAERMKQWIIMEDISK